MSSLDKKRKRLARLKKLKNIKNNNLPKNYRIVRVSNKMSKEI